MNGSPLPRRGAACPLCGAPASDPVSDAGGREFLRCDRCLLIFAEPRFHLAPDRERARYLLHRNTPADEGYVRFLERLVGPALEAVRDPAARALDFGSGPAAVLAGLVRARGMTCEVYDPFFAPEPPSGTYDLIFACEVLEHLRSPGEEIVRICGLLAPGAVFAVMTERWTTAEAFRHWHYTSDPTHIAFYHARTLAHIACDRALVPVYDDGCRVAIFRRVLG